MTNRCFPHREIKALLLVDRKTCQSPTSQRAHGQVLSRHLRDCGLGHYIVSEQLEAEPRHLKLCVEGLPFRLDLDPQVLVGPDEIKKVFADFVAAIPLWITACNAFNTRNSFIDPLLVSAMVALFLIVSKLCPSAMKEQSLYCLNCDFRIVCRCARTCISPRNC